MAERVRALGWKQVEVINSDLGSSAGIATAQREGFERVISQSRTGRRWELSAAGRYRGYPAMPDKDWCRLLEVCQIFGTLIADEQQVYDLSYLDDQLVLGIKGTLASVRRTQSHPSTTARRSEVQGKTWRNVQKTAGWICKRRCRQESRFIPISGSVKRSDLYSRSFGSFGACVRHSTGSEITTLSCRPTRSEERSWSGRLRRRA